MEAIARSVNSNKFKVPGAHSKRKEWVEGLDHEGSESHRGFLSRDVACTSLLSGVGSPVGTGLEEQERGAGWEITLVVPVKRKKNDEYRQIQEILRIKMTRT